MLFQHLKLFIPSITFEIINSEIEIDLVNELELQNGNIILTLHMQ